MLIVTTNQTETIIHHQTIIAWWPNLDLTIIEPSFKGDSAYHVSPPLSPLGPCHLPSLPQRRLRRADRDRAGRNQALAGAVPVESRSAFVNGNSGWYQWYYWLMKSQWLMNHGSCLSDHPLGFRHWSLILMIHGHDRLVTGSWTST